MSEADRRRLRGDLWACCSGFVSGLALMLMVWMLALLTLIDAKLSALPGQ